MTYRTLVIGLVVWSAASVFAISGAAQGNNQSPSNAAITFATETADLLQATLFAALLQEFEETTPDNVEQGKQSIGLVFSDEHTNFRLIGTQSPLSDNDLPMDSFEDAALAQGADGARVHERRARPRQVVLPSLDSFEQLSSGVFALSHQLRTRECNPVGRGARAQGADCQELRSHSLYRAAFRARCEIRGTRPSPGHCVPTERRRRAPGGSRSCPRWRDAARAR